MSQHRCTDPVICPGGNCVGCLNGQIWCQDPRCAPFCPGSVCKYPHDHDFNANMMMTVIIISLVAILFIVWFIYGPQLFTSHSNHSQAGIIQPSNYAGEVYQTV